MSDNSIESLFSARKKLIRSIKEFPRSKFDQVFYGDWTIKQVVAHISAWDIYFTQLLSNLNTIQTTGHWGNIDAFNARQVKARKDLSLDQTIEEFAQASLSFIAAFNKLPQDLVNQKIWPNRSYTPASILKIQIHHYHSQARQILTRY